LRVLGDFIGRDILEFGCGAAQWSIALARLGAHPVGLDLSRRQLEHARRLMAEAGVDFPLVHASAEAVPLPAASFDVVFCDHGAMSFADPYRTVPEVARLLRPGGLFAFNHHSPIETICWPLDAEEVGERLALDYFGMHVIDDGEEVSFQLPFGEWIRLFRANEFVIEDLIEPRPAPNAIRLLPVGRGFGLGSTLAGRDDLAATPGVNRPVISSANARTTGCPCDGPTTSPQRIVRYRTLLHGLTSQNKPAHARPAWLTFAAQIQ
jgi:SAM-dependent methyltransferase